MVKFEPKASQKRHQKKLTENPKKMRRKKMKKIIYEKGVSSPASAGHNIDLTLSITSFVKG